MPAPPAARPRFGRAVALLAGGTALGQALPLAVSPVVSRLVGREDVATLGTFATILSFLAPLACLKYESAVTLPEDERDGAGALLLALLSAAFVAVLVLGLALAFGRPVAVGLRDPALAAYLPWMAASLLGIGAYQAFNAWALRHQEFGLAARTRLVQGAAVAAAQLGGALAGWGRTALVAAEVAGRVVGSGTLVALVSRRHSASFRGQTWADLRRVAARYREFPLYGGPAALAHAALTQMPLALAPLYGAAVFGDYFFGWRFVWAPLSLVGLAMAQVFLSKASVWAREDPRLLQTNMERLVRRLAVLGLLPFGLLTAFGGPVVAFVFGESWREAGVLAQVQAPSWWVQFAVGPILATLTVLERQRWQLAIDLAAVALMVGGFWFAHAQGLSARWAVGLYSGAVVMAYAGFYLAARRAVAMRLAG
jgi:O-antigen/teichoic acid export membrane protein